MNKQPLGKPYYQTVAGILNDAKAPRVLDIACGDGWLAKAIDYAVNLDGLDAYASPAEKYDKFYRADINQGLPKLLGKYDAAVICEAMSYVQNPGLLFASIREHLEIGGTLIISDPNPIFMGARFNYLIQGFARSHSAFVNNEKPTAHMPWNNLGLYQYWILLGLNGFDNITLHNVAEKKPKHLWEIPLGIIAKMYCKNRLKNSSTENERNLWFQAGSEQHIFGRRLVISAVRMK